ncbi:hypothetical protein A2U01_0049898, partial [Trifolium medium]|nr:hypothetical protein [Trifolium medium]
MTGKQSNGSNTSAEMTRLQKIRPPPLSIVRPQVSIQVPALVAPPRNPYNVLPVPAHNLQPITSSPHVDNSSTITVESPISTFMRNFEDSTMNL